METALQRAVRERAKHRCEYCHFPEAIAEVPFQADHIIARQHGGGDELENRALACCFCKKLQGTESFGSRSHLRRSSPALPSAGESLARAFLLGRATTRWKNGNWTGHHPSFEAQSRGCNCRAAATHDGRPLSAALTLQHRKQRFHKREYLKQRDADRELKRATMQRFKGR